MILHITTRAAWEGAQTLGEYRAPSLETEGFIHCSTAAQVLRVANRFYPAVPGLILLWIDPARLRAELKWEPPTLSDPLAGEVFPHIYGALNVDAVQAVTAFEPDAAGVFREVPEVQ
jgi:uncharacterized protein (DUF952 family)